jgi:hypothetical protein
MSFLSKLLIKSITKVIKNLTKFEVAIDAMVDKFKNSCPPKKELLQIVKQKNQIQGALENVVGAFNTVEATAETTNTIVTTVSTAVKVIKAIPVPVSFPPGAGIPINVITLLADSLDTLGDLLKGAKGALKVVPQAGKTIQDAAQTIITKLQQLDGVLNVCIEELAEGMTQSEKNDLINEIGNVAAESGTFENSELNVINEELILNSLSPNSNNPYRYQRQPTIFISSNTDEGTSDVNGNIIVLNENKNSGYYAGLDWLLTIEYNDDNTFSFPQRRIKAVNTNTDFYNIFKGINLFNLEGGGYSYSTSVKVLIDEIKFRIDSLNVKWWSNKFIEDNDIDNNNEGDTSGLTGINPPPEPVTFQWSSETINPRIELPLLMATQGLLDSKRTLNIITTIPSQSVKLTVDTGGNQIYSNNESGYSQYGSYEQGFVKVEVNTNYGTPDNTFQIVSANREKYEKIFDLPNTGSYNFDFKVTEQMDIEYNQGGEVYLQIN